MGLCGSLVKATGTVGGLETGGKLRYALKLLVHQATISTIYHAFTVRQALQIQAEPSSCPEAHLA